MHAEVGVWHTGPVAGLGWGAQEGMEEEPQQVTTQGDTWQAVFLGPPPLGLTLLTDNHLPWQWHHSKLTLPHFAKSSLCPDSGPYLGRRLRFPLCSTDGIV